MPYEVILFLGHIKDFFFFTDAFGHILVRKKIQIKKKPIFLSDYNFFFFPKKWPNPAVKKIKILNFSRDPKTEDNNFC